MIMGSMFMIWSKKIFQGDNAKKMDTQDVSWCSLPVHSDEFPPYS
jgi:hypothetical protein